MIGATCLLDLEAGQEAKIISITKGTAATKRLSDLGLTPKTKVKVLKKALFCGPLEIEVRGSKLVLGRGVASKVLVAL